MNKLKKYIYRGCALLSIGSLFAVGNYVDNNNYNHEQHKLYANNINDSTSDDNSKCEKTGTVVNVETILNVRQEPSIDSPVDNTLGNGETVSIVDEEEGWYEIEKDNTTGYVNSDYVVEHKDDETYNVETLDVKANIEEKEDMDVSAENMIEESETQENTEAVSVASVQTREADAPTGKMINVELTAYCNDAECSGEWGGTTALGTETRVGVIAAPVSIALGSKLYIPDMSYYKEDAMFDVEDRGGAVKVKEDGTYVIDVWFPTHAQVEQFGRVTTTAYLIE